ncbi:GNAT family N-acetyltransferase [Actinomyces sp. 186855]|nr:GNAT family N-acetyltransferase [Actinomyces sp. AC-20-1]MCL3789815.1 GNAT family N-acetyltransferase [Actinomyces sp. 187325]MCL3792441.1 GNAT family N-acetyltransferase [Actinomyces sp. 186855]MCL3794693.1 GNAT family N-acetyltransferase [Actinomyces sp. 217892]
MSVTGALARLTGVLTAGWGRRRYAWPVVLREPAVTVRGLARGPQTVVLRPLSVGDEGPWARLRLADDARLSRWEASLPPGSGEIPPSFRRYVRRGWAQARRGESMPLVLEVDGVFAGQVTVAPIQWGSLRQATVGYWIGSPWEGRGVMTLALAMVIDHLLGPQVGLHRVEVAVRPDNARSLAVCRRLGLEREGLRRGLMHIDGEWADHVVHVRTAEQMEADGALVARLAARAG